MTIVATNVLAALLRTNSELLLAGRLERRSRTPVASAHTTRPHTTTAAVAAGACVALRTARSAALSSRLSADCRPWTVLAVPPIPAELAPDSHMPRGECAMGGATDEPRDRPDDRAPPCPPDTSTATTAIAPIAPARKRQPCTRMRQTRETDLARELEHPGTPRNVGARRGATVDRMQRFG